MNTALCSNGKTVCLDPGKVLNITCKKSRIPVFSYLCQIFMMHEQTVSQKVVTDQLVWSAAENQSDNLRLLGMWDYLNEW